MRREEAVEIFARVPEVEHAKVQIVVRAGPAVSVDIVVRFETLYAVIRGREAGNQDEGRAFFIPYEEIAYLKLERIVKLEEMDEWFSGSPLPDHRIDAAAETKSVSALAAATPPPGASPLDPAEIAKQNLLSRLRAARSVTTGTGKSGLIEPRR